MDLESCVIQLYFHFFIIQCVRFYMHSPHGKIGWIAVRLDGAFIESIIDIVSLELNRFTRAGRSFLL